MIYRNWDIDVTFSIYDMGGQEQFTQVRKSYYQGARAGFIVFDVTQYESFLNIEKWYNEIRSSEPNILLILVGNKVDLVHERKVSKTEGKILLSTLYANGPKGKSSTSVSELILLELLLNRMKRTHFMDMFLLCVVAILGVKRYKKREKI